MAAAGGVSKPFLAPNLLAPKDRPCYRCSQFHLADARDCANPLCCPHCSGSHELRECARALEKCPRCDSDRTLFECKATRAAVLACFAPVDRPVPSASPPAPRSSGDASPSYASRVSASAQQVAPVSGSPSCRPGSTRIGLSLQAEDMIGSTLQAVQGLTKSMDNMMQMMAQFLASQQASNGGSTIHAPRQIVSSQIPPSRHSSPPVAGSRLDNCNPFARSSTAGPGMLTLQRLTLPISPLHAVSSSPEIHRRPATVRDPLRPTLCRVL